MNDYLPIGICGAGNIARSWHIPVLQKIRHVDIAAICDPDYERAKEVAELFGIRSVFRTHEELLRNVHVDAVTIAAPNSVHADMAIEALEMGKHVLTEKPVAIKVEQGEQLVRAAEEAGKVLAVNMRYRSSSNMTFIRNAFREGRLGTVRYAKARWLRRGGGPGIGTWFRQREFSGGGVMMDIGVHMLDVLMWMLGFPKVTAVRGEIQTLQPSDKRGLGGWGIVRDEDETSDVEDFAALHLRLEDGGLITVEVSWSLYGHEEMRVQLFGDQGGADHFTDLYGGVSPVRIYRDEGGVPAQIIPRVTRPPGSEWERGITNFVSALRGEADLLCSGKEGFEILKLIDAAYRSANEGREITV